MCVHGIFTVPDWVEEDSELLLPSLAGQPSPHLNQVCSSWQRVEKGSSCNGCGCCERSNLLLQDWFLLLCILQAP
jgi:hypothetical protein